MKAKLDPKVDFLYSYQIAHMRYLSMCNNLSNISTCLPKEQKYLKDIITTLVERTNLTISDTLYWLQAVDVLQKGIVAKHLSLTGEKASTVNYNKRMLKNAYISLTRQVCRMYQPSTKKEIVS